MKRILGLVALTVTTVFLLPQSATAGVSAVAYFTRNPAAAPPAGGIEVANGVDGVISTGAVQAAEDGSTIAKAVLNLPPSGSGVNAAAVALQACPALGAFKAGKGTLADAPKADCETATVPVVRDGTGVFSADVTSLVKGPSLAVAIVPAKGAGVFQMNFGPPTIDVELSSTGAGGGSSSGAGDFDSSEFSGSSDASSSSGGSGSSGSSGGSFDSGNDFSGSGGSSGSRGSSGFSGSSTFDSGSGSSFGSNTFNAPGAPVDAAAAPVVGFAPDDTAAAAADAGGAALPTRQRLQVQTASANDSGGGWVQFVFFAVTALVLGTAAGYGRNRLVTVRA